VNGTLVSYGIGKLKLILYSLTSFFFSLPLVPMENYPKIDLFQSMNNSIQVVKQKTFANMLFQHLIVITMEPVCSFRILELIKIISYLVDFTEFMLAIALTQSGDLDERLALAFDMYDYNNTGTSK
jgi:hypothetical protein